MALPKPPCPECNQNSLILYHVGDSRMRELRCDNRKCNYETNYDDWLNAYIERLNAVADSWRNKCAQLETENAALRQQVAALQAAQAREPVRIEWTAHSAIYTFDDMLDEQIAVGTDVENTTSEENKP